jgi:hypothetical protein
MADVADTADFMASALFRRDIVDMVDMADTADLMANILARYRREADTSEPRRLEICPRRIGKISKLEQRLLGRRWAWQLFVLPLSEIARVLVPFNHVARFIVNANHGIV